MVTSGSLFQAGVRAGAGLRERRGAGGVIILEANVAKDPKPEIWPFQGYRSLYNGDDDPPDDQPFRVRTRVGAVNNLIPSQIDEEIVCAANSTTLVWVKGTFDPTGVIYECTVDSGDTIPDDDAGTPDVAPSHAYMGIYRVVTDANGILEISPLRKASLNVVPVVTNMDCDTVTKVYQWT